MTEIIIHDKKHRALAMEMENNSKDTSGVEMSWLSDLLDMETNGKVWDVSKLLTWEIGCILVSLAHDWDKRRRAWSPTDSY